MWYIFSDFLFLLGFHIFRYRRRLFHLNLSNSFPEKDQKELKKIEKDFYRNLCDYAVETLKLVTISKEELSRRMLFRNPEVLEKFAAVTMVALSPRAPARCRNRSYESV